MNKLYISLIESIYLIFMFHFFETSLDFNALIGPLFNIPKNEIFEHLIGNEKGLRICPFGRIAIFGLIFILLIRNYIQIPQYIINIILIITFILSLMNINAVIYLLPIFIIIYKLL
jgi:hypothetical protein